MKCKWIKLIWSAEQSDRRLPVVRAACCAAAEQGALTGCSRRAPPAWPRRHQVGEEPGRRARRRHREMSSPVIPSLATQPFLWTGVREHRALDQDEVPWHASSQGNRIALRFMRGRRWKHQSGARAGQEIYQDSRETNAFFMCVFKNAAWSQTVIFSLCSASCLILWSAHNLLFCILFTTEAFTTCFYYSTEFVRCVSPFWSGSIQIWL